MRRVIPFHYHLLEIQYVAPAFYVAVQEFSDNLRHRAGSVHGSRRIDMAQQGEARAATARTSADDNFRRSSVRSVQPPGGRGGIRTHGTVARTPVFKTGALNHSATLPVLRNQIVGGCTDRAPVDPPAGLLPYRLRVRQRSANNPQYINRGEAHRPRWRLRESGRRGTGVCPPGCGCRYRCGNVGHCSG